MVYLDSSALVKLVVREPESTALRRFLRRHPRRVACALARAEVPRAVLHLGPAALARAREVLRRLDLIQIDDSLLDAAGRIEPQVLRTLDAIHLAAARLLSSDLESVVTYDLRMADAARRLALPVEAPA
ncbi:MAG: type II toxin-antitoxin system VapC family toxin [Candidatus Binatia bacterium]